MVIATAANEDARRLREWARLLREREEQESRNAAALKEEVDAIVQRYAERNFASSLEKELAVVVDCEKARFSTRYELFPRSCFRISEPDAARLILAQNRRV